MQGVRILKKEAYMMYAAMMKNSHNTADGLFSQSSSFF